MSKTLIEQLADFAAATRYEGLPPAVTGECKRDILDSIGCALAAIDQPKGRMGIECGLRIGGRGGDATILGTGDRSSIFGAAFANGELINTLDGDSLLLPGHVSPFVLPGAFALGEALHRSGQELIAAVAVSHEMSFRFGLGMSRNRDSKGGKADTPPVLGYSSTVFGATASAAKLKGLGPEQVANALGIAAATSPVNPQRAWLMHAPASTIKYLLAGGLATSALTAAELGELGHRGDLQILDDSEFGYPRFIGTNRWEPQALTERLGQDWRFPSFLTYKPYPHCRVMHAPMDLLLDILEKENIRPDEIEGITAYGEAWAYVMPTFMSREIRVPQDAQFCFAHGLALAAHRVPAGPRWQDPALVFSPSVMGLMDKVRLEVHPDFFQSVSQNLLSRPSRVEIRARGRTYAGEKMFPKGTPSSDPSSRMTDDELAAKFRSFVDGILPARTIDSVVDSILQLEQVPDVAPLFRQLVRPGG